jgi:hypothetical protein
MDGQGEGARESGEGEEVEEEGESIISIEEEEVAFNPGRPVCSKPKMASKRSGNVTAIRFLNFVSSPYRSDS